MSRVTIVNAKDEVIGGEERSVVYEKGLIHRLIRVLLFNDKGELLLQWRSATEDTFPNTWDQSAGGHVDEGEDYETAAYRELEEELGVTGAKLTLIKKFYTEGVIGKKIINRFNAVYRGDYSGPLQLQTEEVEKVKWFSLEELQDEMKEHPDMFTPGFTSVFKDYLQTTSRKSKSV